MVEVATVHIEIHRCIICSWLVFSHVLDKPKKDSNISKQPKEHQQNWSPWRPLQTVLALLGPKAASAHMASLCKLFENCAIWGSECQKCFPARMTCRKTALQQPQLQESRWIPTGTLLGHDRTGPTSPRHSTWPPSRTSLPTGLRTPRGHQDILRWLIDIFMYLAALVFET